MCGRLTAAPCSNTSASKYDVGNLGTSLRSAGSWPSSSQPCVSLLRLRPRVGARQDLQGDIRRRRWRDLARDCGGAEDRRGTSTSFGHAGGAGNRGRRELQPAAEAFARHGIVTLIYDKRRVGYSLLRRDFVLLAADAVAAVAVLSTRATLTHLASDCGPNRRGPTSPRSPAVGQCGQVRDHSRRGRGDSSGADRLGLRPFLRHAGVAAGLPAPWRSPRFGR